MDTARAVVTLALTALVVASPARSAELAVTLDGVEAVVWTPDAPVARAPVVVFSHGIALCATQSRYLTQAAARAGYLVVAPQHADRNCVTAGEEPGDSRDSPASPRCCGPTATTATGATTCARCSRR